ncbi:hypothetical protein [Streptomyces sp. NPDC088258]|uniref:hypothetical protein n=1 Tax=Streptomyces sp. NPDC088258 TaxID=3365849 RepID=UPI0037FCC82C
MADKLVNSVVNSGSNARRIDSIDDAAMLGAAGYGDKGCGTDRLNARGGPTAGDQGARKAAGNRARSGTREHTAIRVFHPQRLSTHGGW